MKNELGYYSYMKSFFVIGSIFFSVVILIIGFQNFGSSFDGFTIFFTELQINGTLTIFGIAMLGIMTGAFYYGLITELIKQRQEDEEPSGGIN